MAAPLYSFVLWMLSLLLFSRVITAFTPDFSNYPVAAQSCLYQAADESGCNGETTTVYANNACLCGNSGNWVTNSAKCIAASDPNDPSNTLLSNVYNVMLINCGSSNTPLSLTWAQFLAVSGASSATSSSSTTSTFITSTTSRSEMEISTSHANTSSESTSTTSSPTSQQDTTTDTTSSSSPTASTTPGGGGLTRDQVIAVAVGVPTGFFTILGAIVTCCMCMRH